MAHPHGRPRPPPPLAPRAHWDFRPHRRPLRICCARLHFADRFRAGAGRRPGSGRRQGVRFMVKFAGAWGWSFLSRPLVDRGVRGGLRWLGRPRARRAVLRLFNAFVGRDGCEGCLCEVRVRESVCPVCPGSPRCLFTGKTDRILRGLPACISLLSIWKPTLIRLCRFGLRASLTRTSRIHGDRLQHHGI